MTLTRALSDECESESDDDLEFLLLDSRFSPMHELGPHLNLLDVEETACEQWFRYVHYIKPDTKCAQICIPGDSCFVERRFRTRLR